MKTEVTAEQMEQVNGGTIQELKELASALGISQTIGFINVADLPGANSDFAETIAAELEKMGIRASFDLGIMGSGLGSQPNSYHSTFTGQNLTHQEVLMYIEYMKKMK